MDEHDMVVCRVCREEVTEGDICETHEMCLWCDTDCKLAVADDELREQ